MDHKKDQEFEQTLAESELLLRGAARSASDDADLTLESILAEFGSREDGAEAAAEPEDVGVPEPRPAVRIGKTAAPAAEPPEPQPSAPPEEPSAAEPAQDTVSLQEVLESTVQSVLDEEAEEPIELLPPKRRGLFSRRRLRDTERLYSDESGEEPPQEEPDEPEDFFTEDFGERDDTPEPDAGELAADYRDDARMGLRSAQAALLVTALSWLALLLDHFGVMPALFAEERLLSCLPFFIAELLVCVLGRDVFVYAFEQLRARTVTYELLSSLACAVTLADTALDFFLPARAALAVPFHAVAMLGMSCALLGRALLFGAMYDTFRVAAVGEPDYLVTVTAGGAAKRRGSAQGFSRCAQREDAASHWQGVLLPVLLAASLVFAVLSTLRRGERLLFLWNWGVLLTAINMLAFPLCYSLPLRRLTKRFVKSGSALAGYVGADRLRRSNCVILTDTDLFPPGTVSLNGLKIYGEESGKVISYAATMAHASQSGLSRLFDTLLEGEGGRLEPLDDLSFYEEGGVSGLIHGETVLFGTAAFCRKMHVTMPGGLSLKTGAFLAVDGTLIAVFRRQVHGGRECGLGAPRAQAQPHHAGARRARRQHHARAFEAQVRHRRPRGLSHHLHAPCALGEGRRASLCAALPRGADALRRDRRRQQASGPRRARGRRALAREQRRVRAAGVLPHLCRRVQRAHPGLDAALSAPLGARGAHRRLLGGPLLSIFSKNGYQTSKITIVVLTERILYN